jgi:hypothetical protein
MKADPEIRALDAASAEESAASRGEGGGSWIATVRERWPIAVVALGLVLTLVWCVVLIAGLYRAVEWAVDLADFDHTGSSHEFQEGHKTGQSEATPEPNRHPRSSSTKSQSKSDAAL